ncbi:hypothetical protein V1517DRAFT_326102 [Lipomyces orientalis]|uniref:Uncharacterized protein n=1 Tax=Lipomyces orientalis TaxID=1233043 RepID=A0ACC3TK33_9ASCO
MSLRSRTRTQRWRNRAIRQLHTCQMNFEYAWGQIPEDERPQTPPSSESQDSEFVVSSFSESPQTDYRRPNTRSQTGCRPQETMHRSESMDSSDSDPSQASSGRKRPLNPITLKFCTQRCLLSLAGALMWSYTYKGEIAIDTLLAASFWCSCSSSSWMKT